MVLFGLFFASLFGNSPSSRLLLYLSCDPLRRGLLCYQRGTTVCSPGGQALKSSSWGCWGQPSANCLMGTQSRLRSQKAESSLFCVCHVVVLPCVVCDRRWAQLRQQAGGAGHPHRKRPRTPGRTQGQEGGFRRKEALRSLGLTALGPGVRVWSTQTHLERNVT